MYLSYFLTWYIKSGTKVRIKKYSRCNILLHVVFQGVGWIFFRSGLGRNVNPMLVVCDIRRGILFYALSRDNRILLSPKVVSSRVVWGPNYGLLYEDLCQDHRVLANYRLAETVDVERPIFLSVLISALRERSGRIELDVLSGLSQSWISSGLRKECSRCLHWKGTR